jgi:hypothetical protein
MKAHTVPLSEPDHWDPHQQEGEVHVTDQLPKLFPDNMDYSVSILQ